MTQEKAFAREIRTPILKRNCAGQIRSKSRDNKLDLNHTLSVGEQNHSQNNNKTIDMNFSFGEESDNQINEENP